MKTTKLIKKKKKPKEVKKKSDNKKKVKKKTLVCQPSEIINKIGRPIEWTPDRIAEETKALIKWSANPENYYLTRFLAERKLDTAHLDRFAKYDESFCLALKHAKQLQECKLVELAISKKGDGGFIKFVLQNKAGWKDKTEISGDAANPLAVIMDRIAINSKNPLDDYDDE